MDLTRLGSAALAALILLALPAPAGAVLIFQDDRSGSNELRVMSDALDGTSAPLFADPFSGADQQASVSEDRTRVVFESDANFSWDVWLANVDGTGRTYLGVNTGATEGLPSLAGDGDRFAYQSTLTGDYDIRFASIETGEDLGIPNGTCDADESDPDFQPAGNRIAFQSNCAGNLNQIFVVDAALGPPTQLTFTAAPTMNTEAKWSPDGTRIAFTRESGGAGEVWVMNADGSGQQRVTDGNAADDRSPAWSPDGARIAFVSNRGGGDYEIWTVPSDGSAAPAQITEDTFDQGGLDWVGGEAAVPNHVSVDAPKVAEGGAGGAHKLVFTLTLDRPADGPQQLLVDTSSAGSATGDDFEGFSGRVVEFAAGATQATLEVTIVGDAAFEPEETVALFLHGASGGIAIDHPEATGIIDNDDPFPHAGDGLLAYECNQAGLSDVCLADVGGSFAYNLTGSIQVERAPALSPDGTRIAFAREGVVTTMEIDGGNVRTIGAGDHPSWFPDSQTLAYAYDDGGEGRRIWTASDSGDPAPAPVTPVIAGIDIGSPEVSPDGALIAFDARPQGAPDGVREIFKVGADGQEMTQLTFNAGVSTAPAWSPDGQKLAFTLHGPDHGLFEDALAIISADGSGGVAYDDGVDIEAPTWSPDGTRIAYGRTDVFAETNNQPTIAVIGADGTGRAQLVGENAKPAAPSWRGPAAAADPPAVSVADASAPEGEAVVHTISLGAPAAAPVSIQYWALSDGGSASAGGDFAYVPGTVSFKAGEQQRTIAIPTIQDSADEPDETYTLLLHSPGGLTIADGEATGTILDDDGSAVGEEKPKPDDPPLPVAEQQPQPQPAPQPAPAPEPPAGPEPDRNETVVATPVRGTVLVKLPGAPEYVDLADVEEIPNGTVIDARRGRVQLRAAQGGEDDVAVFYAGIFKVSQVRGLTTLTLQGAIGPCRASSRARVSRKRKVRRLWGSGKGRFRTNGKFSSATVRGTTWLVEDSCAGTLTRVTDGSVTVRDRVRRTTIVVRKGRRYLARARRG